MFIHLTTVPFTTVDMQGSVARRVMALGKPLGLWYAPDLVWVKRMDRLKSGALLKAITDQAISRIS